MNLLLLGANGGCGRWVARLATERGIAVTAVVRHAATGRLPDVARIETGNVLEDGLLDRLVPGHDFVISCLGLRRVRPWNPWSALASPPDLASRSAALLVAAMTRAQVRRVVAISAAGVGDSAAGLNRPLRWLVAHSTLGAMYADLERMEAVLRGADLDWCTVRPVTLIDGAPRGRARELTQYRLRSLISRGEVAKCLVDIATAPGTLEHRTPMLGWR